MSQFIADIEGTPHMLASTKTGDGGTTIIETPLAVAQKGTVINGPASFKLSESMLGQMVKNYSAWRGEGGPPAPGYFGHARDKDEQKARDLGAVEPALYVLDVWLDGPTLMGRLEFMPWAWDKANAGGARPFRGLSIVFKESAVGLDGKPIGAVFHGVDVVPEPLLPIEIAAGTAAGEKAAAVWASMIPRPFVERDTRCLLSRLSLTHEEETIVDPEQIKKLSEQVGALTEKLTALEASIKEKDEKIASQQKTIEEMTSAAAASKKSEDELKGEIAKNVAAKAAADSKRAITLALEKGVLTVAEVEGWDKDDASAVKAMSALGWFKSPEALIQFCDRMPEDKTKVKMNDKVSAGKPKTTDNDDTDPDKAQEIFLAKIEEVRTEEQKASRECDYGTAMTLAAEKHPKEYKAYAAAMERSE